MESIDATEMVNTSMHESALRHPDVAIVGELNPDLILYGVPHELPEEREVLASGFTLTLGSSSAILAHNLSLLVSKVTFSSRVGCDVAQYLPRQAEAIRTGAIHNNPVAIIQHKVRESLARYAEVCGFPIEG